MWTSNSFDCAVSNLPWDKQIQVESITDLYEGTIHEYNRIVKPGGAIVLLLTKPELMVKLAKKECRGAKVETRKIGYLGQTPTIVNIQKSN